MAKAVVDPAELRRFARTLRRFNADVVKNLQTLSAQLHNLGATWRDQEHRKFSEEFTQQITAMNVFMENTDEYVRYLLRKAEAAEQYLNQR